MATTPQTSVTTRLAALAPRLKGLGLDRQHRRETRQTRAARHALERELATYQTPAEVSEMDAILSRYDDRQSAEMRDFLHKSPGRAA